MCECENMTRLCDTHTRAHNLNAPTLTAPVYKLSLYHMLIRRTLSTMQGVFVHAGDDIHMEPHDWPARVLRYFDTHFALRTPRNGATTDTFLGCLVLNDRSDPGYPSFPVIGAAHMNALPSLLPDIFLNQGGCLT